MTQTSSTIRTVQAEDFPQLQQIKPLLTEAVFAARCEQQKLGQVEFLVVEDGGELTSFVLLKWQGKPTHPEYPDLEDLYTKKSCRGKGYAATLVAECEHRVGAKGFKKLGMAANRDPACPARKLYDKLGYAHDGKPAYLDGVYNGMEDWCVDLEKELK